MRTFLICCLVLVLTLFFAPGLFAAAIGGVIAITVSGLIGLFLIGGVMLLVGLIFGSTLLAMIAGAVTLLVVGFSVFWPLLLLFLIIWLCTRTSNVTA